ncbi:heme ABC transporter permease [Breoghania sp.]|uniref:heme ABC transporter permease n=1 Tax=Breoghania sp. TaxID=2065378 RepID=UPI00261AAE59|nr:heme ABC transporter permease [Breoghania sp.]MDJ0931645.1 heme ABC transporter permease [Breoghania sp.]
MAIIDLANPTRFMRLTDRLLPWLVGATVVSMAIGLYLALYVSPEDYQQGATVKIMYIHVPFAWLSMFAYTVMAIASFGTLVWKHPLSDVSAKAAAPIGAAFTFLCLVTGSLWGKPMWGTWWVWDARLTSVLVLFIMYLGIIALWRTIEDPIRAGKAVAVLTLVGYINIPIIKFSVNWWNTLHQPASVVRMDGPSMPPSILIPLLVNALAFTLLFMTLHFIAMRSEILRRRIRTLRQHEAAGAAGVARATTSVQATASAHSPKTNKAPVEAPS